jgi:hypothetical protein
MSSDREREAEFLIRVAAENSVDKLRAMSDPTSLPFSKLGDGR